MDVHLGATAELSAGCNHGGILGDTGQGDLALAVGHRVPRLHGLVEDQVIRAGGVVQGGVDVVGIAGQVQRSAAEAGLLTVVELVPLSDQLLGGGAHLEGGVVAEGIPQPVQDSQGGLGQSHV